jgi:HEPN domain-containing protein
VIDITKHVAYWRGGAVEDWEVARGLVDNGKPRHGLFFAHLALEKALKALVCRSTGEIPPRIHDLVRLASLAGISVEEEGASIWAEFNSFSLQGRYPDSVGPLPPGSVTQQLMKRGDEVLTWLLTR